MNTKKFISGDYHTHFIDENEGELLPCHEKLPYALIAAAVLTSEAKDQVQGVGVVQGEFIHLEITPWQELGKWEICSH